MPITLTGNTGIQTPGLASDTMPTSGGDAVVESGSNSDGQWTRWADGTQWCLTASKASGSITVEGNTALSPTVTFQWPVNFSEAPNANNGHADPGSVWAFSGNASTSQVSVRAGHWGGTGSQTIYASATGRWK